MSTASAAGKVQSESDAALKKAILSSFTAKLPRKRTSIGYAISMGFVAILMVLLPLLYLAMIVAVGWVAWWHLTHNYRMVAPDGRVHGKATLFLAVLYLTPAIAAGTIIVFMLKPFFSRRREKPTFFSLERSEEPFLFEFVDRLCDAVRAPRPRRIDLTDDVNASAGFRRGWWSMLTGNDLVLTIGLPIIGGLDLRQLSSILAHEFGHFTQAGGMRFGYVIESINRWFARVVFERDEWDDKLDRSADSDENFSWVMKLARVCVGLSRRILSGLMRLGVLFSRRLSRQMEFDADAVAAAFAGPAAHHEVDARMYELAYAQNAAYSALSQAYREGRLVDDLPALIVGRERLFSRDERKQIARVMGESKANWYDTHPSVTERRKAVDRLGFPGVFDRREPASVLFNDFEKLSKRYTSQFYRDRLGDDASKAKLCKTSQVLAVEARRAKATRAATRYLAAKWGAWNFLPLPERSVSDLRGWSVDREKIVADRETMLAETANFAKGDELLSKSFDAYIACNWPKTAQQHGLQLRSDGAVPTSADVEKMYDEGRRLTERYELTLSHRLLKAMAIRFQEDPEGSQSPASAELWDLFVTLRTLEVFVRDLTFLRLDLVPLRNFIQAAQSMPDPGPVASAAVAESATLLSKLEPIWKALDEIPYPFKDNSPDLTIAKFSLRELPKPREVIAIHNGVDTFCESVFDLRTQIACLLMAEATKVEQELGLEPLGPASEPQPAAS